MLRRAAAPPPAAGRPRRPRRRPPATPPAAVNALERRHRRRRRQRRAASAGSSRSSVGAAATGHVPRRLMSHDRIAAASCGDSCASRAEPSCSGACATARQRPPPPRDGDAVDDGLRLGGGGGARAVTSTGGLRFVRLRLLHRQHRHPLVDGARLQVLVGDRGRRPTLPSRAGLAPLVECPSPPASSCKRARACLAAIRCSTIADASMKGASSVGASALPQVVHAVSAACVTRRTSRNHASRSAARSGRGIGAASAASAAAAARSRHRSE